MTRVIISLGLIFTFIAGSVAVSVWLIARKPAPEESQAIARAPLVGTIMVEPQDVRETIFGYGTARSDQLATLTAEVNAPVVELVDGLKEGVAVEAGQLLVRLDDRQYRQELREAESARMAREAELVQVAVERRNLASLSEIADADLQLNRDDMDRVKSLFEKGNAPKTEYDRSRLRYQGSLRAKQQLDNQIALLEPGRLRVEAALSGDFARADRARLNIERCHIVAPFSGSVASIKVEIGDKLLIGHMILRLVNLDHIEIPIELPVSKRPRVVPGATVALYVESMRDVSWRGKVSRIAPVANERTRTFAVYVEVDNGRQDVPLMPGYFVKADVEGPLIADAFVVPRSAIVNNTVYVADGHQASPRKVRVSRYLLDRAVIEGEITRGERIITTNLDVLYDGAAVRFEGVAAESPAVDPPSLGPESTHSKTGSREAGAGGASRAALEGTEGAA